LPNPSSSRYGIEKLYLFPYYQTREDYAKAAGKDAPAFDHTRPPKYWEDPGAIQSSRRNVVYDQVLALSPAGLPVPSLDGKPMLEPLVLSKAEAAQVNIPPKGPTITNVPGAEVPEVPPPLRNLAAYEELCFGFGGTVFVRNKSIPEAQPGFTEDDRAVLVAIAAKLGL
jgi:hypothetical protein